MSLESRMDCGLVGRDLTCRSTSFPAQPRAPPKPRSRSGRGAFPGGWGPDLRAARHKGPRSRSRSDLRGRRDLIVYMQQERFSLIHSTFYPDYERRIDRFAASNVIQ